jgi:hypothetical protein
MRGVITMLPAFKGFPRSSFPRSRLPAFKASGARAGPDRVAGTSAGRGHRAAWAKKRLATAVWMLKPSSVGP